MKAKNGYAEAAREHLEMACRELVHASRGANYNTAEDYEVKAAWDFAEKALRSLVRYLEGPTSLRGKSTAVRSIRRSGTPPKDPAA